jgi:energy-coupling factor transporter ATP-binding protein EcfA2
MYTYRTYQLNIHSEIPLRALTFAEGEPDVLVVLANPKDLDSLKSNGGHHFVGAVEGVATFAVFEGRKIIVDPLPGVDDGLLNTFIIGPILAVLLRQRGLLVLHGSSVVVEDGAIAFLGNSGAGKSTLAQAFHRQGHPVLTDDVMVVQLDGDCPMVLPGYPLIKLWPESATAMGYSPDSLPCIHGFSTKRSHQLTDGFGQNAFPLQRIYILDQGNEHRITNLNASDACLALLSHSRASMLLTHSEFRKKNFRQCTWVAQHVPMARFERKPALDELSELIKLVEADLSHLTAPLGV